MKTYALTPKHVACLAKLLNGAIEQVSGDLNAGNLSDATADLLNDYLRTLESCRGQLAPFDDLEDDD